MNSIWLYDELCKDHITSNVETGKMSTVAMSKHVFEVATIG